MAGPAAGARRRLHRRVPRHPDDPAGRAASRSGCPCSASRASRSPRSSGPPSPWCSPTAPTSRRCSAPASSRSTPPRWPAPRPSGWAAARRCATSWSRRRCVASYPRCSTTSSRCRRTPPWSPRWPSSTRCSRPGTTPPTTSTTRPWSWSPASSWCMTVPAGPPHRLARAALRRPGAGGAAAMTDAAAGGREPPQVVRRPGGARTTSTSPSRPRDVVCLIGSSGSGKSTLLRCLNLLEDIDDGVISFEGREVSDPRVDRRAVRSRIGMVFQAYNLFPHLTVLDNFTLAPRKVHGLSRREAEARARELLGRFGLAEHADQPPRPAVRRAAAAGGAGARAGHPAGPAAPRRDHRGARPRAGRRRPRRGPRRWPTRAPR